METMTDNEIRQAWPHGNLRIDRDDAGIWIFTDLQTGSGGMVRATECLPADASAEAVIAALARLRKTALAAVDAYPATLARLGRLAHERA